MRKLLLMGVVCFAVAGLGVARPLDHKSETVPAEGAERLQLKCEFGAGELVILPASMPEAAKLAVEYDASRVDYRIDYEVRGRTGYLDLESDWKRHNNVNTDDNRWELTLPTKLPLTARLEIGACDAEIDLGGISLTELNIEVGAASGNIDFSAPNPERLKEFQVEAGASSLTMSNLGNANFEYFKFEGGAGSFDLDFRGEYHGEAEAKIVIGMGSADITIPRGLAVRVETDDDNWFSSVDLNGGNLDKISDGVWETPDYDDAKDRLVVRLDVGMGSVDFRWKK